MVITASPVVAGASPAAADEPTVVVTPDEVFDGQQVGMDISGFPAGYAGLVQCSGSILEPGTPGTSVCTIHQVLEPSGGLPPPRHVEWTVVSTFPSYDGARLIDCRTEPSGCVAGVVTISDPDDITSVIAAAYAPITFLPDFSVAPSRQLAHGATVMVEAEHVPAGTWAIAQCGRAVVDDPTPAQVAASCGPALPVTVGADGTVAAELTVHDPLTTGSGATVPCGSSGCAVVLTSADDPVVRSFKVAFGPATLDVVPTTDIPELATVRLTVGGAPDGAFVRQCVLPVGATLQDSRCDRGYQLPLDEGGGVVLAFRVWASIRTLAGELVDCRVEACALVLFDASVTRLVEPVPITLMPPPSLTAEPSVGLLDGQEMAVVAENMPPGAEYSLAICTDDTTCDSSRAVTVAPDGRIETTIPARQQFTSTSGSPVYCRANCHLVLQSQLMAVLWADYAMAEGELTVVPAEGLSDGQQVQVTGRELMPTYAGAAVGPFPSGGWALTQCDRAVLDQPDLFGAFTHCSVAPPTRGVTIDGSTLDTELEVQATITKILGGTTDCAAAPGACVVGLVRLEQDISLSTHLVPVTFD